jgi:hypothetical protein
MPGERYDVKMVVFLFFIEQLFSLFIEWIAELWVLNY